MMELLNVSFDYAITVCGNADERRPFFPGQTRVLHASFDDPPKPALLEEIEEEKTNCYRRVRDEIRAFYRGPFGFSRKTA